MTDEATESIEASATDHTDETAGNRKDPGLTSSRRTFLGAMASAGTIGAGLSAATGTAAAGVPTPRLHTEGRWIRDPAGNDVTLRGMAPADPGFYRQYHPKSFEEVLEWATDTDRGWHPNIVRLPCTQDSIDANRRLRDAGFKVGFHMMPGQPGMSEEMCLEDFRRIFEESEWKPDYLKIYPTLVVEGTAVYDMWHRDDFEPLDNESAAELVAEIKSMIPRYTRLQRVQRDIPADHIEGGVWKSNLRQLARQRMDEHGWTCECIRCREVGHNDETPDTLEMDVQTYEVGGGTEHFISIEDFEQDLLVGFCRLRFPNDPVRRELADAAVVRELHVYGSQVGVGRAALGTDETASDADVDQHQHQGYGQQLIAEAERLAADAGYPKVAVISGIGAREYYRQKLGYRQDGPYVSRRL